MTTLGADGARVDRAGEDADPGRPVADAEPREPTGAGDAFRAGFLAAVAWGSRLERAAQLGNMMAVHALETVGPQEYELKPGLLGDRFAGGVRGEAAAELSRALQLTVLGRPRRQAGSRRGVAARTAGRPPRGSGAAGSDAVSASRWRSGYHGPPELTAGPGVHRVDRSIPWALAFVLLLGGLYLAGVRRVRRAGQPWPAARPVAFCGLGLGSLVIATMSWVGVYQGVLFYVRAVQTILLLLVIPLFFALGRPLSLAIAALPRLGPADRGGASAAGWPRSLTFPAVTTLGPGDRAVRGVLHVLVRGRFPQRRGPRADLPGADGAGLRVLLDAAAGGPGAQGVPVPGGRCG